MASLTVRVQPWVLGIHGHHVDGWVTRLVTSRVDFLLDGRALTDLCSIDAEPETVAIFYVVEPADAIQIMLDDGKSFATRDVPVWEDCGNPDALLQTNRYLLDNGSATDTTVSDGAVIQPSYVHPDAEI